MGAKKVKTADKTVKAEAVRPKKGSGVAKVTLEAGGKRVTLHQDGRTEAVGLDGKAASVAERFVEDAGGTAAGPGAQRRAAPDQELMPVSLLRVPTSIGKVAGAENGKYVMTEVRILREEEAGRCLLTATDGRAAAAAKAEVEDYRPRAERPDFVPAVLARPVRGEARELRFGAGPSATLFGSERVWVDVAAGEFRAECPDGASPPFADVFPKVDHTWTFIGINTALLAALAAAVNSAASDIGPNSVTIALRPGGGPIAVIGDCGIGVLATTHEADASAASLYEALRKRLIAAERGAKETP